MGTSNWQNISYNIELIRKLNPASILDVGAGFGRWGILFREFLEIWDNSRYDGKWERIIDAVEIYSGYIKDYHHYFYNNIYIEDALTFLKKTDKHYDLINFGDVIEHFTKPEGEELISLAMERARYVLINIPIGKHWEQKAAGENPYEEHKSVWYNNDFTKFTHYKLKSFNDLAMRDFSVVLLSNQKIKYVNRYGRFFGLKNFLKHKLGLRGIIAKYEKHRNKIK